MTRKRRVHRERAQVPAAGQPRSAAGRDRGVRGTPVPPDRADPAAGDLLARELRDEAAVGQPAGHHEGARRPAAARARRAQRLPLSDLPSRRGALHAGDARAAARGLRRAPGPARRSGAHARRRGARAAGAGRAPPPIAGRATEELEPQLVGAGAASRRRTSSGASGAETSSALSARDGRVAVRSESRARPRRTPSAPREALAGARCGPGTSC